MNHRPHPGLTLAVAAALAGTAPLAPPAAADDEPLVERCYTQALTDEEVAAGAVSEIDCYEVPADEPPMALRGGITYAIVYDAPNGVGSALYVGSTTATTCIGANTVFPTGHVWDNRISSIDLVACGAAKHWQWTNFSGNFQLVMGAGLQVVNGPMDNATSSIQFA